MLDIKIGDRVTGRCVTLGRQYTGTVAEIIQPAPYTGHSGMLLHRLINTGQHYHGGRPIEPIVELAHPA